MNTADAVLRDAVTRCYEDSGADRLISAVDAEINRHTAFKLYPKSGAERRTVPVPDWLVPMLRDHTMRYSVAASS
jgi:hypothetical protein